MASRSLITTVERAISTGVQPQVSGSFRKTARTYYELLGMERNKYTNISE